MTESDFYIIQESFTQEVRVKRSVFKGIVIPAKTKEIAEAQLSEIRKKYYDATHNCFAYRIDSQIFRYSDDGEPSGTAGKPIFMMLEKYGLIQALVVVTRYYGGIKLGTGGLIRAYGLAAEETIQNSDLQKYVEYQILELQYPYHFIRKLHYIASKHNAIVKDTGFAEIVTAEVKLPKGDCEAFTSAVFQAGEGQIHLTQK